MQDELFNLRKYTELTSYPTLGWRDLKVSFSISPWSLSSTRPNSPSLPRLFVS